METPPGATRAVAMTVFKFFPAVGGTWIASCQAIAAGDWHGIPARAKAAALPAAKTRRREDVNR